MRSLVRQQRIDDALPELSRAAELALRLKYAGVPTDRLHVVEDLATGLDHALAHGSGPLYALPTYTALLELRGLLSDRGAAKEYWRR